jgi:hypothetical protein
MWPAEEKKKKNVDRTIIRNNAQQQGVRVFAHTPYDTNDRYVGICACVESVVLSLRPVHWFNRLLRIVSLSCLDQGFHSVLLEL